MPGHVQERQRTTTDLRTAQRAIVLQLLRHDHVQRWACPELAREIDDLGLATLEQALAGLERDGVLNRENGVVWASRAARRLDDLALVGV